MNCLKQRMERQSKSNASVQNNPRVTSIPILNCKEKAVWLSKAVKTVLRCIFTMRLAAPETETPNLLFQGGEYILDSWLLDY